MTSLSRVRQQKRWDWKRGVTVDVTLNRQDELRPTDGRMPALDRRTNRRSSATTKNLMANDVKPLSRPTSPPPPPPSLRVGYIVKHSSEGRHFGSFIITAATISHKRLKMWHWKMHNKIARVPFCISNACWCFVPHFPLLRFTLSQFCSSTSKCNQQSNTTISVFQHHTIEYTMPVARITRSKC